MPRVATARLAPDEDASSSSTSRQSRFVFSVCACAFVLVHSSLSARAFTAAEIDLAAQTAADVETVTRDLADDSFNGRQNNTAESTAVQNYLIDELSPIAAGLFDTEVGDAAYRQDFLSPAGTNILGVIEGRSITNEYVIIGAHYDHLGGNCSGAGACDQVFNGATDNAAGVAVVLAIGRALRALPTAPLRSVILAIWDAEEDGLAGSEYFVTSGTVPLGQIVSYLNFDIQGANLLPSLRDSSFAVGAESGGATLQILTQVAINQQALGVRRLNMVFGQDRSDHANFYTNGVPTVFFSDATGGCYHTTGDDISVVDLLKLSEQSQIGFRLALALAETTTPPTFVSPPPVIYADAVVISDQLTASLADLNLFSTQDQNQILSLESDMRLVVDAGSSQFGLLEQFTTLNSAASLVETLTHPDCDGFILVPEPGAMAQGLAGMFMMSLLNRAHVRRARRATN